MFAFYSVIMFVLLLAKQPVVMPALITARYNHPSTQVFGFANANEVTVPPTVDFVGTDVEIGCDIPSSSPSMELFSSIQSLNYEPIKAFVRKLEFDLDFKPTISLVTNGFDAITAFAEDFSPADFIRHFDYDFDYDFDYEFLKSFQRVYEKLRSVVRDCFFPPPPPPPPRRFDIQAIGIEAFGRTLLECQQVYEKMQAVVRNCFFSPPPPPRRFDIQAIGIEAFGRTLLELQQVYEKLQAVVRNWFAPPPPPTPPRNFDIRAIAVKAFKNVPCFNLEYSISDALHKIHEVLQSVHGLPPMCIIEIKKQPTTVLTLIVFLFAAAVILQQLITRAKALVAPAPVHDEISNNEIVSLPAVASNSSKMLARTSAIAADEENNLDEEEDPVADLCHSFSTLSIDDDDGGCYAK